MAFRLYLINRAVHSDCCISCSGFQLQPLTLAIYRWRTRYLGQEVLVQLSKALVCPDIFIITTSHSSGVSVIESGMYLQAKHNVCYKTYFAKSALCLVATLHEVSWTSLVCAF